MALLLSEHLGQRLLCTEHSSRDRASSRLLGCRSLPRSIGMHCDLDGRLAGATGRHKVTRSLCSFLMLPQH